MADEAGSSAGGSTPASTVSSGVGTSAPISKGEAREILGVDKKTVLRAQLLETQAKLAAKEIESDDSNKRSVLRARAIDAERKLAAAEASRESAVNEVKAKYESTLKQNALLSEAQKLGLRNPEYLKLVDTSKVSLDGDAVKGAAEAVKALYESDRALFGDVKSPKPGVATASPSAASSTFDPSAVYTPEQIKSFSPAQLNEWKRANGLSGPLQGRKMFAAE